MNSVDETSAVGNNSEPVEQEEEHSVEQILNKRTIEGKVEYFSKWKGYSDEYNTWVPQENIDCEELIRAFEENLKLNEKEKTYKEQSNRKRTLSNSTIVSGALDVGPSKELKSSKEHKITHSKILEKT